ncbi:MAG: hypothetical protein IT567_00620 [Alphaproteobacteria bacterium]|nr:hypothetical protein [Alphaproteobacteria bacterium]
MRTIVAMILVLGLAACKPIQLNYVGPREGPEEYLEGYDDGCDSAVAVEGDFWQKMFYGHVKDPDMAEDKLYKNGWNEGYSYCRSYMGSLKSGGGPIGEDSWFGY